MFKGTPVDLKVPSSLVKKIENLGTIRGKLREIMIFVVGRKRLRNLPLKYMPSEVAPIFTGIPYNIFLFMLRHHIILTINYASFLSGYFDSLYPNMEDKLTKQVLHPWVHATLVNIAKNPRHGKKEESSGEPAASG